MTRNIEDPRPVTVPDPDNLFKIDEPLHRPPDGYHVAGAGGSDSYAIDPEQIDDN